MPKAQDQVRSRKRQRTDGTQTKSSAGVAYQYLRPEEHGVLSSAAAVPDEAAGAVGNDRDGSIGEDDTLTLPNQLPPIADFGGVPDYAPLSPETTVSAHTPRSGISIHNLSFIMHPSHEATSDTQRIEDREHPSERATDTSSDSEPVLIARACYALNISPDTLYKLIDLYFDKMTSFSLFRQPYFRAKIRAISSSKQLNALLAAMLSFSSRFDTEDEYQSKQSIPPGSPLSITPSDHFLDLALQFIDKAIQECGDEAPSLCLLQAMTLATFQQLIKGVYGRAWRSLGTCVRVAHELYLHVIDSENIDESTPIDTNKWCFDEEKRRVWWAIWEMDTFASTIRRCSTAIDWSQTETNLPVDDEYWFRGEFQRSCFLTPTIMERWKTIQCSGNQSPKAWFIVVNSLMREAQLLSSPRGVFRSSAERSKSWANKASYKMKCKETSQNLAVIENALRCFQLALPASLKYNSEYLNFASNNATFGEIQRDSSVYSIHVMIQLTKFMIYHHGVFGGGRRKHCHSESADDITPPNGPQSLGIYPSFLTVTPDSEALNRYSDAADKVLLVVNNCAEDHIQYTNPFIASTIWLAAAVQLVYKVFCPTGTKRILVDSNFEVLRLNHKRYVEYWKMSTSLQQNLDYLAEQLKRLCSERVNSQGPGLDDLEIRADLGSVLCSQVGSANNTWPLDNQDLGFYDNSVCATQAYDNSLFNGSVIPTGNGDLGGDGNSLPSDPLEFLETLAFGLNFRMDDFSGC
ncbi:hypothetical protein BDZ45DRAFT_692076 [Acephala macrosclerotiorum]|nr:hypothetical protein BDZ45DRAFT_692076 [Acephala macrosclerotiorum]